ncbi:MAG: glycosyltransferase family 4 protein [Burkholderiaceae bacterium]
MRILHLDPDDLGNPLAGGGPVRTYEIYRRLARRHEITVLTPTFPGSTPELLRDGVRYVRLGRRVREHGSSHHITFALALPRAVRRFDHDLLVEDFMPPASATWTPLFRRRDRPLIASVQWFFARKYTDWLKLPFHWGEEYGVRLYDHFVVLTPAMRARITARSPTADCRVIPNGVDDALFGVAPVSPAAGRGVLFLGRTEIRAKGLDLLLLALARMPEPDRPPLTIAGTLQDADVLNTLIDDLGLRRWVTLTGGYDAAGRLRLLRDCRVLAMPSRDETFGMTIAEANAAARLAVVWDLAPMNEVAAPDCPRVAPYDVDAYAAALAAALASSDDELARRGEAVRDWARRYDWDAVAAAQEAYYLEVMERFPRRRRGRTNDDRPF